MSSQQGRHYICSNKDGTEIYFGSSTATSLDGLAPALFVIGCHNALNLDAGASRQFLYNGKRLTSGSRNILDGFVISHREINIGKIEQEISELVSLLESRIRKGGNIKKSQQRRDTLIGALIQARNNIYNNSSVDIYSETGIYLGYRLEVREKNS